MNCVNKDDIAVIDYHATVFDDNGEVLARESGRMRLRAGDCGAMGAIDVAVVGMAQGESKKLKISPEQAFGRHDPALIMKLPRSHFRMHPGLKAGSLVRLCSKAGKEIEVVTRKVGRKSVTVDANHPLAGKTLNFDMIVHAVENPNKQAAG